MRASCRHISKAYLSSHFFGHLITIISFSEQKPLISSLPTQTIEFHLSLCSRNFSFVQKGIYQSQVLRFSFIRPLLIRFLSLVLDKLCLQPYSFILDGEDTLTQPNLLVGCWQSSGREMANLEDIIYSAATYLLTTFAFLLAFAILRLQPINDRVYFPKWYLKGIRASPTHSRAIISKFVNMDFKTYIRLLSWMLAALRMPEPELIDHAGLDSVVYIRIYLMGLKIFVPITLLAFAVLVPVNWTAGALEQIKDLTFSDIDKLSISNIPPGSRRFWAHVAMSYVFTFWTLYVIYKEYKTTAILRLQFLASESHRPDHFTVLVRNIPPDPDESVTEHVEHFFCVNHPDHYLTHQVVYNANKLANLVAKKKSLQNWLTYYQNKYERNPLSRPTTKTGFWGLWGTRVDAIDFYTVEIGKLNEEEDKERERVISDPNAIVPVAFVSFKSRWGAAVCAQTQQTSNPTIWLTERAPEPRDVYWDNLAIPYVELTIRRLLMALGLFFLIFFFMIPIAIVQSMASIQGIEKVLPFLKPLIEMIPKTIGVSIPLKATFFITYIMVDGWAAIAAEILRLVPLIKFHLKNTFLVKTEQDRDQAMDPGGVDFAASEPRIQFYFLLGIVYAAVTPLLLPFIIVFFSFSYVVFRHQIINVYNQKYESGAAFWPDVHQRLIIGLVISQLLLLGLMSTKDAEELMPLLVTLPILTIWFHVFCKGRFESAFVKFPLQDAMVRDTLERATNPNLNLKLYLHDAYVHPVFKGGELERTHIINEEEAIMLVTTRRNAQKSHSK
ncbi:CSC1-like protein At4g02900 isoform X2 [Hevea brasiliensis]|uniref:CSC1-like protein At4g02900 isoform X2 n=1 Tax=Hevea brasiliensis TaxID=3981 RepID=UPI0025EA2470|nr:CSC1-like protein At4g02900 isoform X2 [Hevea brasiliensis]